MLEFIKDRISVIVALIAGTGTWLGMAAFIDAKELKDKMIAIAVVLALLVSLLVSSWLRRKKIADQKKVANRLIFVSIIGLIIFFGLFYFFNEEYTVKWNIENDEMKIIGDTATIKGLFYTTLADEYIADKVKKNNHKPSDNDLLDAYGYNLDFIWTKTSRTYARLLLLFLYAIMVSFVIGGVTVFTDVKVNPDKKTAGTKVNDDGDT